MVGTPAGLYYLLGVLMLAVAGYDLMLLGTSAVDHRMVGRDVEISHVAMGVAMAGMFVPAWSFGPSVLWESIFAVLLIWFLVRSVQSVQEWGLHVPHTLIHAVMSLAMLLMYWFPRGVSSRAMSMSVSATGARMDPGLAFLITFVLFGSAIFTLASPNKGASHYGTHCGGRVRVPASDGLVGEATASSPSRFDGLLGTPSLVDASHVVMSIGMGLMLILMT
jgi:hypothetical protein